MAKEIKFNIKLTIDGKEQLGVVTTDVGKLRKAMDDSKSSATKLRDGLISVNQAIAVFQNVSEAVVSLQGVMQGLTASYNAVQQANTQLTTVMKQRMNATEDDVKSINAVISAQSKLGVVGGVVQKTGAQQIATFLYEKRSLETLIPAMNNLIAQQKGLNASEEDGRAVANLMGKAMMGQTSALKRVGITFTESQKQIMEYGTESQRAAMLAQIIKDNVGDMNAELGKTDAGQMKHLEQRFAAVKLKIGEIVQQGLPFVSFIAQTTTLTGSVIKLGKAMQGAVLVFANSKIVVGLLSRTITGLRTASLVASASLRLLRAHLTGTAVGATTAAFAVKTLQAAVKGLLISTGVGIAIYALTEVISSLSSSSDDAAAGMKALSAAEESAKAARAQEAKQIYEVQTALDMNISKLKDFKGSKTEEKKLVSEMNSTYGEAMGYYSTVAQWYTALTGNSKAYCNQMINEIRIRSLANQAADLQQKRYDLTHDANGKTKKFSAKNKTRRKAVGQIDAGDGKIIPMYQDVEDKGTSQRDIVSRQATALYRQEQNAKKQMEALIKQNAGTSYKQFNGYSSTMPGEGSGGGKTTPAKTGKAEEKEAVENSIDWYQKKLDDLRKKLNATGDEGLAKDLQKQYEDIEAKFKDLKIRIGVEKPDKEVVKTALEQLQDELQTAQKGFDNAVTVDAKVEAMAKVRDIQAKIDEATKGKVTIAAIAEPTYIKAGSNGDKRQSHSNAQAKAGRIQSDYEIGLIGKDQALQDLREINAELDKLGLKPVTIDVQTEDIDKAKTKMQGACDAISAMGSSLSGLGEAIEVPELNIAGTLAQAIATMTAGYATATTQAASMGPWAWVAFAATGLAQLVSMISTVKSAQGFATGGVIGGTSVSGDRKFARVNSGEMILNKFQQTRLFNMVNGANYQMPSFSDRSIQPVIYDMGGLANSLQPPVVNVDISMNPKFRRMVEFIRNEEKVAGKSGKKF